MIEVPSAALTADLLAEHADFFSIGTNDLDSVLPGRRSHRRSRLAAVRAAAPGDHPDDAAGRARRRGARGIPVSVCGEMAADPVLLTLLVGLGLREFSMAPTAIPLAKQVLRGLRAGDAQGRGRPRARARTAAEVEKA